MIKKILSSFAAIALCASGAAAQQTAPPIELGVDAGLTVGFSDPQVTVISVPIQAVRVGFFVNDRVSVEPKVGLNVFHTEGETFSSYDVETGVLYHFSKNPIGRGVYLRPYAGFQGISGGGDSETRGIFGAGFGAKIPFADRFATRMEIGYQHMTAPTNGNSDNALIVLFGLSIFSH